MIQITKIVRTSMTSNHEDTEFELLIGDTATCLGVEELVEIVRLGKTALRTSPDPKIVTPDELATAMVGTLATKIEAIKAYRARTGLGLREAKEAIEAAMTAAVAK
jgi:ribosomal protein L7/L12